MLFTKKILFKSFLAIIVCILIFNNNTSGQSMVISSPASSGTYIDNLSFAYTISGESNTPQQIKINFNCINGPCLTASTPNVILIMKANNLTASFVISETDLTNATNSFTVSPTVSVLTNGTYSITAQYTRSAIDGGAQVSSNSVGNVTVDNSTNTPTLSSPVSNSVYAAQIPVSLTLGESYLASSAKLTLTNLSGTYSNTLTLVNSIRNQTFTITSGTISSTSIVSKTRSDLPDDIYNFEISYRDIYGHSAATATNTNIKIQTATPTPSITSPVSSSVISRTSTPTFTYTLPSTPLSGSAYLTLSPGGYAYQLPNTSGTNSFYITSAIPPDGTFTSTVSYMDFLGNPAASSASVSVIFDRNTLVPTITSPLTNGITTGTITLTYNAPELALSGTKKITISKTGSTPTIIILNDNNNGIVSLNLKNLTQSASQFRSITGTTNISDGTYSITYSYQDQYGNPTASNDINSTIDSETIPIAITTPIPNSIITNNFNLNFTLPEAMLSGSATLKLDNGTTPIILHLADLNPNTYNWNINPNINILTAYPSYFTSVSPSATTNIPAGNYSLTLNYNDALANPTSSMIMPDIRFKPSTLTPKIKSPIANSFISSYILYKDSLSESNSPGTKKLIIIKDNTTVSTITLNNNLTDSIYFNIHHLAESLGSVSSISGSDSLVDGTYVLKLSYQDIYGNPAATINDTINIDSSPLIGILSHTSNTVYGPFTETLTFNKSVEYISNNPILPNIINNSPSVTLGQLVSNTNKTIFTFQVTPLQTGIIKLEAPFMGVAIDKAGNHSQVIAVDSISYVDTTATITPVISGSISFCQGDSVLLTSSTANAYLWSNGATTRSITVKQAGTYNVKATYSNSTNSTSNNITISSIPIPTTPVITRNNTNYLVSSASYGNNWYLSGTNTNDTANAIKPTQAGLYTARTIQNGCASSMSGIYYYLITDIINLSSTEFIKVSPNPFTTQLNLDFSIEGYQKLNLEIFNMTTGEKIANKEQINAGNSISTSALSSGTYMIRLSSPNGKINKQFKMIKL